MGQICTKMGLSARPVEIESKKITKVTPPLLLIENGEPIIVHSIRKDQAICVMVITSYINVQSLISQMNQVKFPLFSLKKLQQCQRQFQLGMGLSIVKITRSS